MNERIKQLSGQALDQAIPETWTTLSASQLARYTSKFAELLVEEACRLIETRDARVEPAPHIFLRKELLQEQIGWIEREEGYYKLYAPEKGSIVTHAFILCKYCNGAMYHCMGPKYDAVCLTCYEKDPDERTN